MVGTGSGPAASIRPTGVGAGAVVTADALVGTGDGVGAGVDVGVWGTLGVAVAVGVQVGAGVGGRGVCVSFLQADKPMHRSVETRIRNKAWPDCIISNHTFSESSRATWRCLQ